DATKQASSVSRRVAWLRLRLNPVRRPKYNTHGDKGIKELPNLCLKIQTRKKRKTRSHPKTSKSRLSQNRLLVLSPEPRLVVWQDRSALLSVEWWALSPEKPRRSDVRLLQQQGG